MGIKVDYKYFNIIIIGTGATGSQLLPFLAQLSNNYSDKVRITLIDGDAFETKNLKNQKCTINDIGHSKTKVLANRYSLVYPDLNIRYIDKYALTKEEVIKKINRLERNEIPILISCVDNNASRKLFHEVFHDNSVKRLIYIDSGNGTEERSGQVVVGYKKEENVLDLKYKNANVYKMQGIVKLKPVGNIFPSILKDNDTLDKLTSCTQVVDEHPQNIATNIMAATTIFSILNEIIGFNTINTHIAYFDAETTTITSREAK